MLIEFRVTNFRSIKETQTLSMVATADDSHQESNCIASGIKTIPYFIRSAALYGANASGKSNLILALATMRHMVALSPSFLEGQQLGYTPFRFDTNFAKQSTEFEVIFIKDNIRYQYGFAYNAERITKEWLLVYKSSKPQRWFERTYNSKTDKDEWDLGTYFAGDKEEPAVWKERTRKNVLFLSKAVDENSEQLRPVFNWFNQTLKVVNGNFLIHHEPTATEIFQNTDFKQWCVQFLQAADLGIADILIERRKVPQSNLKFEAGKLQVAEPGEIEVSIVNFVHQNNKGAQANIGMHEESQGTQKLFGYLKPLFDVLEKGEILVVDELESSLHPIIARSLIELFHNPKINRKNAQLIFSTHNISFLDKELFRRDQFWFIERDNESASQLYSLTDFKDVRKSEALEKRYLMGRYGAIPFVGEFKF